MNKVNVNKMAFWVFNFTYLNCVCNVYGHVNVINIKNRPMKAVLIVKNIWGFCLLPHFLLCVLGVFPFFKNIKVAISSPDVHDGILEIEQVVYAYIL